MPTQRQSNKELRPMMKGREYLAGQEITSVDSENRTVDIIFFSGIDVPRTDWWTGQKYVLRFDSKGGDFSLLNAGAPVLDNHPWNANSSAQKGKVEKAWQEGKLSKATLRFSKRPSVDEIWQDIEDKIITKFSMGVSILAEEKFVENNMEIRLAKKWQPFELSIAPIPADFGTTTLAAEQSDLNQMGTCPEENKMPDNVPGTGAQTLSAIPSTPPVDEEALRRQAIETERKRIADIREIALKHGMEESMVKLHIEKGTSVADFKSEVLNALAVRHDAQPATKTQHIDLVADECAKRRDAMELALDGMFDPKQKKEDNGNPFLGLSLLRFAEESVRLQHGLVRIPNKDEVVKLAMQNTSDFANVLENSARKQLLRQYELAPTTYKVWTKPSTTPDFKTMSRSRLSEAPRLIAVGEGAQITIAAMSDSKEQYAVITAGRGVSFTRQMLINDDLGAFNNLISQMGLQAGIYENKTVYAILAANANMADGNPLFDDTHHHNAGAGALGNTGFDTMYTKMRGQKGLDGVTVLNIIPKYIIVPAAKETTARMALVTTGDNVKASDRNYFAGRLEPVSDAELDNNGSGTTKWYGAADPDIYPGIEYAHLEGSEGPQFIRKENESGVLGIQFYVYTDFGAKAVDWRPLYYSTGS
ncbi:MAG: Mu-like prophage major head subunit gpT family protein [Acidobacteria bacterium]|nr:Mu-like prophage major head subunit gpT family protein [Acidobacteriota bacterium]